MAIVAQRFAFLGRGLLSARQFLFGVALVGVAPIMVCGSGLDWPSKAAVVALVTFLPDAGECAGPDYPHPVRWSAT